MNKEKILDIAFKIVIVASMILLGYNIVYWFGRL